MDRRLFLKNLVGGVAVAAAVRTFPFRVFSFPSEIKVGQWIEECQSFEFILDPTIDIEWLRGATVLRNKNKGFRGSLYKTRLSDARQKRQICFNTRAKVLKHADQCWEARGSTIAASAGADVSVSARSGSLGCGDARRVPIRRELQSLLSCSGLI
jgi:hypothetical protein